MYRSNETFQRSGCKVCFLVCLFCYVVSPDSGTAEDVEQLYSKGMELFENELYEEASLAFRRIQEIQPHQKVYFNIGQCELILKNYDLAIESFTLFLADKAEAIPEDQREFAEAAIQKIESLVGRLDIVENRTFKIWIDGGRRGETPLEEPLFVGEGEHELVLKDGTTEVLRQKIVLKSGETITVAGPEEKEATGPLVPPPDTEPSSEEQAGTQNGMTGPEKTSTSRTDSGSALTPIGFSVLGVGAVSLVAGITTGALVLSKANTLEGKCYNQTECSEDEEKLHESATRLSTATNVLIPVGGVLAVSGIVLAVIGYRNSEKEKPNHNSVAIDFKPMFGQSTSGISVSGSF